MIRSTTHDKHGSDTSGSTRAPHLAPERRADRRFRVEGGAVRMPCRPFQICGAAIDVTRLLLGLVPWSSAADCDVLNLSKGGLCFESSRAMSIGERVELQLWVPGREEAIELKGHVRWCQTNPFGISTVGIQFAPFSRNRGDNAPEALQALRELEAKHI